MVRFISVLIWRSVYLSPHFLILQPPCTYLHACASSLMSTYSTALGRSYSLIISMIEYERLYIFHFVMREGCHVTTKMITFNLRINY